MPTHVGPPPVSGQSLTARRGLATVAMARAVDHELRAALSLDEKSAAARVLDGAVWGRS